jgi:hypothetical protein
MKKHTGFLKRILSFLIMAGLVAAAILFYLGFDKADQAEADHTPVAELYTTYVGDNPENIDFSNTDIVATVIDSVVDDNSFYSRLLTAFGDHTVASLLVKEIYLPDDEFVSTTIAQRILIYRMEKAYSNNELLLIYCYVMGYSLNNIGTIENIIKNNDAESLKDLLNINSSLIDDILGYLTENGYLSEENADTIKEHIN